MNDYVRWTKESEGLDYVGILIKETETAVIFLTKRGEFRIPKDDGIFSTASLEDFENDCIDDVKVLEVVDVASSREGSKKAEAIKLFNMNLGKKRKEIIEIFKQELQVGNAYAATLYQQIK